MLLEYMSTDPCFKYDIIERLARQGMTFEQVADFFEVSKEQVTAWLQTDPQFKEAWSRGRLNADHLVEQALFRRAVGYQTVEVTESFDADGELKGTKKVTRATPPSELSMIFWLKNRLPHLWQERTDVNVTFRDMMDLGHKGRSRTESMIEVQTTADRLALPAPDPDAED
jgi:hypothetical protein